MSMPQALLPKVYELQIRNERIPPGLNKTYCKMIDSMGIFNTLQFRKGGSQRFWSADVTRPYACSLRVYDGAHLSPEETAALDPVVSHPFLRVLAEKGVVRREVREGRVRGTLFLPPPTARGRRRRTCVVTLHGSIRRDGVCEDMAALLASRGFPGAITTLLRCMKCMSTFGEH